MRDDRLEVSVTFDEQRGYVGTAPEIRAPVVALSLSGLRHRIEALLLPDSVEVKLVLDHAARQERDQAQTRWCPSERREVWLLDYGP